MKLDDILVFHTVLDCKSYSEAARNLGISPSSVSKRIYRLEVTLGVRLFERNTRYLKPTKVGLAIVEHTKRALASLEKVTELAQMINTSLLGELRIAAPISFGSNYVAPLIADFCKIHPQIKFDLQLSDHIYDLYEKNIDLAIRVGNLTDSSLIARRVATSRRILVASPEYLNKYGVPHRAEDLVNHVCLLFSYPGLTQNHWDLQKKSDKKKKIVRICVTGNLCSDNGDSLNNWSIAGMGIALREAWNIADDIEKGVLVRVLPEWEEPGVPISIVRTIREPIPQRLDIFINFLSERWVIPPWD